jgi:hypothetical protein
MGLPECDLVKVKIDGESFDVSDNQIHACLRNHRIRDDDDGSAFIVSTNFGHLLAVIIHPIFYGMMKSEITFPIHYSILKSHRYVAQAKDFNVNKL